jgi:hypothetical protein
VEVGRMPLLTADGRFSRTEVGRIDSGRFGELLRVESGFICPLDGAARLTRSEFGEMWLACRELWDGLVSAPSSSSKESLLRLLSEMVTDLRPPFADPLSISDSLSLPEDRDCGGLTGLTPTFRAALSDVLSPVDDFFGGERLFGLVVLEAFFP